MLATLTELLENLKPGLLWVNREGVVRFANAEGATRTGVAVGRRVSDAGLARTVAAVIAAKAPRAVTLAGAATTPGGPVPDLACRVIPGLGADDAFVLVKADAVGDAASAYDNLLQVVRSDLRDPLAALRLTLGKARWADASGERDELLGGIEEVVGQLDKLVDLATLWGSGALLADDRIELWSLLQAAWQAVEPLAIERKVTVRFRTQTRTDRMATLYGSEVWIRRVFQECLDLAVRGATRGATIDIEHRQMGPRALVVFRDSGLFAPRLAATTPLAEDGRRAAPTGAAPAAGARLGAREHISLKLCQHIVSLHGGLLREESEDGMRNLLIDLPTGAPHRDDQARLDIAQAQRYAHDLAALMARSRGRRRAADTPADATGAGKPAG